MKYRIDQKWFSLRREVAIHDQNGLAAFRIDGRAFSFGKKLSVLDHYDNELAFINQKMLDGNPVFEIYHSDDLQAIVSDAHLTSTRCKLAADAPAPDDLHAEGNFSDREYTFTREGRTVGRVSKSLFPPQGTYGVEVGKGEDEVLLIASAAVIDLCCHSKAGLQ